MLFAQLKYSERQAEKAALTSLLNEYFDSRASSRSNVLKEGVTKDLSRLPSTKSASAPHVAPKSSVLASGVKSAAELIPTASNAPGPRGPPPINRKTRPVSVRAPPPSNIPPPPLETSAVWSSYIPTFQYLQPDHVSPGIDLFNRVLPHAINELHSATISIFNILYENPDEFRPKLVQSPIQLILRYMPDGVAHAATSMSYTGNLSGESFSNVTHKSDFVLSTNYLASLEEHPDPASELRGVTLHELTHTFQYGSENIPGGLREGIADFVRLRGGYAASHWTENPSGKSWDNGYETTAYFLDWADKNIYEGFVVLINDWLGKNRKYDELAMFNSIMPGWSWDILWEQYLASR